MSFDLIIANPPYGKSSSLSKKIVNALLKNKVAKEMVVLAPRNLYKDSKILAHVAIYQDVENRFTDAIIARLTVTKIVPDTVNKYTYENISLNRKQLQFEKAVGLYNSSHEPFYVTTHGYCTPKRKEALKDVNEDLLFVVTSWCAYDKVSKGNNAEDRNHNLLGQPINWRDNSSIHAIQFDDPVKLQNFKNWWYKVPGTGVDAQKTLIYFILDILCEVYGRCLSIKRYLKFLPHVDWSHPWTDQEILKELGLPEGFLEEK